ncbi:peptidoglycan recognition protein family protein [Silvimonas iriomotensis]|uniref:N-acetylmuramoyl-L-alanine amidase n=1 Tax=Silvimonas iriomotensis TaxID=449662 RepID=A0ABQ2P8G0_9NEIS|nr:peptidoglycan recognition family protein [Silvimonas iriomotensis]GGP20556.1 hypothetical protein GCM10010970_15800 [Silvimonas iriomotensis]
MPDQSLFPITADYLPSSTKRRSGALITPGVRFVVAHDTGNPGSTAAENVSYYKRSCNAESASAHVFVDDRSIIECIPALTSDHPEKAWHVRYVVPTDNQLYGYDANDAAIGIEYCFGPNINADEAYRRYVWVLAYTCLRYGLDASKSIVGHFFLDPQRRTDPVTGLAQSRRTYEQLLRDVAAEAGAPGAGQPLAVTPPDRQGSVTTTAKLNLRAGEPSRLAPVARTVPKGMALAYVGWTDAGEPVNGNPRWYRTSAGEYFWSGGVG